MLDSNNVQRQGTATRFDNNMRAFDRNGQLCGRVAHARCDPMDGAADQPSNDVSC